VPGGVVRLADTLRTVVPEPLGTSVTVVGLRKAVGPTGVTEEETDTLPEKPLRLDRRIVEAFVFPTRTISEDGEAEMEKSGAALTVTVCENTPTVP